MTRLFSDRQSLRRIAPSIWLAFGIGIAMSLQGQSSTAKSDSLFTTVKALDGALFDAYNRCDVTALGTMVADDLEFYHDKTGLSRGKARFLEDYKKYICGKVTRQLVSESLTVYPLNGYGAVEIGVHRFHHPGKDDTEPLGEAKFTMLWQQTDAGWKLSRVISYDHAALEK